MKKLFIFVLPLALLIFPSVVFATIGVGVGTGKMQITEKLHGGTIYSLPPLSVINTGDEPSDYQVGVSYLDKQPEQKPSLDWFNFSPQKFHLEPGKAQIVDVKLNLPLKVTPGNYFAYLEARPVQVNHSGSAVIGIAAASKLYFTIDPANFFQGVYYRATSLLKLYSPWPERAGAVIAGLVVIVLAKKFLNIQIGIKKHDKASDTKEES